MFNFAYPGLLILLALIPIFVALYFWARYARTKKLRQFGNPDVISHLMPAVSPYKPPVKLTLWMTALALLVIALARPWGGIKDEKNEKEGIEVVIAVDASNSMNASSTSSPDGPTRMRTAKLMLEKLVNRLDNDRVGLIMYAGDAYTLIPVTSDYVSVKMFLNSIDPSQIKNQGTDISAAIDMANKSFSADKKIGKALVLITDAEDLENSEGVMEAARAASDAGIQIDVIGVGTETPVPIRERGGYFTDDEGNVVQTALNEDLGADIAKAGRGIYVNASNSKALSELEKQLDTVKKTTLQSSMYAIHDEIYALFLWPALILLVLDIFILDRKIGWLDKISFFRREERGEKKRQTSSSSNKKRK